MNYPVSIFWFRQDLRLSDNQALLQASKLGEILPIYILDNLSPSPFKMGSVSKICLHNSLISLNKSLGDKLNFYIGDPEKIICDLIDKYKIQNVFWNRCYEPWLLAHDEIIESKLQSIKVNYTVYNSSYLWNPEEIKKDDNSYYKVFGAYKRKVYSIEPRRPVAKPERLISFKDKGNETTINDLQLIPDHPWQEKVSQQLDFGEITAQNKLDNFINQFLLGYKKGRDYPSYQQTSKLSQHLHFGEISANQIWESINITRNLSRCEEDAEHYLSELIWREFSCYLMVNFKKLPSDNFQSKFNSFPWRDNDILLKAWQTGKTGYPIVDAGMRQLWQTGYMHNRVRMIVASFLVKNLMIHWHYGRDWFWDCLADADLANNSASWQWVAGSGADAAPYFRIFNPIIQGEKFDSNGYYTRKFVPELKNLPDKYLFKPWTAPDYILKNSGVILGKIYPYPIVDLAKSRIDALEAYNHTNSHYIGPVIH
jgi:deoxyribodipyrimidine photo-lyase